MRLVKPAGRLTVGGVRVIYITRLVSGAVVLLTIYGKGARDTNPANVVRELAKEMGRANE